MDENDARRGALELMETAEAAYLATVDAGGGPRIRAMFNLRRKGQFPALVPLFKKHETDFLVYFTTNTSSWKVAQAHQNSAVAVYYCIPEDFRGLELTGNIEVVADMKIKRMVWQKGWELYYPGGVEDPDNAVLAMRPASGRYYRRLDRYTIEFGGGH